MIEKVRSMSFDSPLSRWQPALKGRLPLLIIFFIASILTLSGCSESYNPSQAKALIEKRCVQCHKLPSPSARTDEEWEKIVPRMNKWLEQRGMPTLSRQEISAITRYLKESN